MFKKLKDSFEFISKWKSGEIKLEYEYDEFAKKYLTAKILHNGVESRYDLWTGNGPWFVTFRKSFEDYFNYFGYIGRHFVYWIVIHDELKRLNKERKIKEQEQIRQGIYR